ncbi:MAG: hydrogenase iron-sulfur subunit [Candidatus Helarchaeota archaeon]
MCSGTHGFGTSKHPSERGGTKNPTIFGGDLTITTGIILGSTRKAMTIDKDYLIQELNERDIPCIYISKLLSSGALEQITHFIEKNEISHLIIGTSERSRILATIPSRFPKIIFEVISLPEVLINAPETLRTRLTRNALQLLLAESEAISLKTQIEGLEFSLEQAIAIIGGGLAGVEEAILLSRYFQVYLIEKNDHLGGNLYQDKFLYPTGQKSRNLIQEKIKTMHEKENITIFLNSRILDVAGGPGQFDIVFEDEEGQHEIRVGAAIISTGFTESGLPNEFDKNPRIITHQQLGEIITDGNIGSFFTDGSRKQVLFVDLENQEPYELPTVYMLSHAIHLLNAGIETIIVTKNIYASYKFENLYQEVRKLGGQFINGSIQKIQQDSTSFFSVEINSELTKEMVIAKPDLIVLSTSLRPSLETVDLLKIMDIFQDDRSFIFTPYPKLNPTWTGREGILMGGSAWRPMTIPTTLAHASAAAFQVHQYLTRRQARFRTHLAVVDEKQCIGCRICQHFCAFKAIEFKIPDESSVPNENCLVAEINAELCKGCGACMSVCPTGAVQLKNFDREYLFKKVETLMNLIKADNLKDPVIIGFTCQECAGRTLELLKKVEISLHKSFYNFLVPCAGRLGIIDLLKPLVEGADGVLVFKCPDASCHYFTGSTIARMTVEFAQNILEEIGLQKYKIQACDVIAVRPGRFETCIETMLSQIIKNKSTH